MRRAWLTCAILLAATGGRAGERRPVSGPLVVSERWPRATDLVSWTSDVMRIEGLEHASETAQGKALFEWLRLFSRMAVGGMIQAYEGAYGKERPVLDAHKQLFVYGWGYCDTTSRIADAAWSEYKRDARAAERVCTRHDNGGYHTMYRLRMDGRYGAFDPRYGYYLVERDAPDTRVLDWDEVGKDENFHRNRTFLHRSRPFFEIAGLEWERALLLEPAYFESEKAWRAAGAPKEHVFGDSHYRIGTRFHDMSFTLLRGSTIERFWDNSARKFYVPAGPHTRREFPFLPSGRFYRVTVESHGGNWPRYDPNYRRAEPFLAAVPRDEGYPPDLAGGHTIGQAWGRLRYEPDLRKPEFSDALAPGSSLIHRPAAPYLRPWKAEGGGQAVFDIRSPYVLVDGTLEAELTGPAVRIELRTLEAKTSDASQPDVWSSWQTLAAGAGRRVLNIGRARFNGVDAGVHGVYRFQVRIAVEPQPGRRAHAGLSALRLSLDFENGIMSLPRIFAGSNVIRFQVEDAGRLRGPVRVEYRYRTAAGEKTSSRTLQPGDFRGTEAVYVLNAPGLLRCDSVSVSY